jgi:hypothetical protein
VSGFSNPPTSFPVGVPVTFNGPVTMQNLTPGTSLPSLKILSPNVGSPTNTAHGLEVDNSSGAAGQLIQTHDNLGNPMWNLGATGGPNMYGDNVVVGSQAILQNPSGVTKDPGGNAEAFALALSDPTNVVRRLYLVGAVPGSSLGSNGDVAINTAGAAGAILYEKAAGAWTAKL